MFQKEILHLSTVEKRMKIAVNARLLIAGKMDGMGRFMHEILKRVVEANPQHEFHFYFDRPFHQQFIYAPNVQGIQIAPRAFHPLLFNIFFQSSLKKRVNKGNYDLFLSLDGNLPIGLDCPSHYVLHDVNFLAYPEGLRPAWKKYYSKWVPQALAHANQVATVSHFSKTEINHFYPDYKGAIDVVYNASNLKDIKGQTSHLPTHFFLFVGTPIERKNVGHMLKAFELYRKNGGKSHWVLIGRNEYLSTSDKNAIMNSPEKSKIHLMGRLTDAQLVEAYQKAKALLFVSKYEGFGIPLLEAMELSCPIICSETSVFPEIVKDAGIYVNPEDINQIQTAMNTIENNAALKEDLIQKGQQRAQEFSWEESAILYWQSVLKSLEK